MVKSTKLFITLLNYLIILHMCQFVSFLTRIYLFFRFSKIYLSNILQSFILNLFWNLIYLLMLMMILSQIQISISIIFLSKLLSFLNFIIFNIIYFYDILIHDLFITIISMFNFCSLKANFDKSSFLNRKFHQSAFFIWKRLRISLFISIILHYFKIFLQLINSYIHYNNVRYFINHVLNHFISTFHCLFC
jgi:hypothetical protein